MKFNMGNYKQLLSSVNTFIFDIDGVMTNGIVLLTADGDMLRSMNVKDGYALHLAARKGYRIAIISGGSSQSVIKRFTTMGIHDVFLGVSNKIARFEEYIYAHQVDPQNVLYMGDDIPDYEIMTRVGLPVCPADAAEEIKHISKYISHHKGGEGCVRDVLEQVMKVHGTWLNDDGFHW